MTRTLGIPRRLRRQSDTATLRINRRVKNQLKLIPFDMISKTTLAVIGLICCWTVADGQVDGSTTREPSIQAYGLPKNFFAGNGFVRRVYEPETSAAAAANIRQDSGKPIIGLRGHFRPTDGIEDGTIEIIHLDSRGKPVARNRRQIEDESSDGGEIMQTQESKVFRPLFVYRQQVARRQKIQQERNAKAVPRNLKPRYNYNKNSIQY